MAATTTAADETELSAKVRKQVEFYFSDSNLPTDKFMQAQIAADPEGCT